MTNTEFDTFEANLLNELMKVARSLGMLGDTLLASDDIDDKWKEYAPEYMADAVKNVNSYPEFSIACAGYVGMAIAKWWDEDWGRHHSAKFASLLGDRGFDNMDDHIMVDILGHELGSTDAAVLVKTMEVLAQTTWNYIRHSSVEAGTADAFNALARACRCLYRIGAAIILKKLGYRFQAVNLNQYPHS